MRRILLGLAPVLFIGACAETQPRQAATLDYGFDRPVLNEPELEKLNDFAARAGKLRAGGAAVQGHADRSGPDDYNMELSRLRAETARRELIARGLPAAGVVIAPAGETTPARPTEDGVIEPLNRRVVLEIVSPGAAPEPMVPISVPVPQRKPEPLIPASASTETTAAAS